jgi:hypothetical protein
MLGRPPGNSRLLSGAEGCLVGRASVPFPEERDLIVTDKMIAANLVRIERRFTYVSYPSRSWEAISFKCSGMRKTIYLNSCARSLSCGVLVKGAMNSFL